MHFPTITYTLARRFNSWWRGARKNGAAALLTTQKDAVKFSRDWTPQLPILACEIEAQILDAGRFRKNPADLSGKGALMTAPARFANVQRILVRSTNWVGDAVMSLPALEALRARFPRAEIVLLSKPWVSELYWHHPAVNRQIIYKPESEHRGPLGFETRPGTPGGAL